MCRFFIGNFFYDSDMPSILVADSLKSVKCYIAQCHVHARFMFNPRRMRRRVTVVNPRRMREGYCSRSVCVSVSLSVY